ncbi:mariner Mos1 transposase [Trichonephila clavipes]|nr:mariner Mos1 transposase [Trichonephila clavipes]
MLPRRRPNRIFTVPRSCSAFGGFQLGVVYYELLKPTETITGDRYRTQLMRLNRTLKDKRPQYNERHDKVILQHDKCSTPCCKKWSEILGNVEMGSPTTHCILQTLLPRIITCFDQWHTAWLTSTSGLMKK